MELGRHPTHTLTVGWRPPGLVETSLLLSAGSAPDGGRRRTEETVRRADSGWRAGAVHSPAARACSGAAPGKGPPCWALYVIRRASRRAGPLPSCGGCCLGCAEPQFVIPVLRREGLSCRLVPCAAPEVPLVPGAALISSLTSATCFSQRPQEGQGLRSPLFRCRRYLTAFRDNTLGLTKPPL